MTATTARPMSRRALIAQVLAERIEAGKIPPASPIPVIPAIRAEFGVSNQTASSATAILAAQGLIVRGTDQRWYVRRLPEPPGKLSSGVLADHLRHLRLQGLAAQYRRNRREHLGRIARVIGVPLLEATEADLLTWRDHIDRLAPGTIRNYVTHTTEFYAWAHGRGLLPGPNPATRLPTVRPPRRLPRPAAEDDVFTALDSAPDRIRLMLVLAGWCGLRACEIALLDRSNIRENDQPPVLIVADNATKGRRERIVKLSSFVVAEVRAARLPVSGFAFRRWDGKPGPNTPNHLSHLVNTYLHECGLTFSLHQLRHRFGTQAYKATRDIRVVQELLGHSSPQTTAGYADWDRADAAAAVEAIPVKRPSRAVAS
jgi:integrase/recombinase XerC